MEYELHGDDSSGLFSSIGRKTLVARIAVLAHTHHAIGEPYAGGIEMHTAGLCQELSRSGHDVELFAKAGSDSSLGYAVWGIEDEGFKYQYLETGSWAERQQSNRIRNVFASALSQIEEGGFDFVINNSLSETPLVWDNKIPVLTIFHTPVLEKLRQPAEQSALHDLRAFASVSAANAKGWQHVVPQVSVIPNGIDLSRWKPSAPPTDELRWSARLVPDKGLELAIAAAAISGRTIRIAGPMADPEYFESCIQPLLSSTAIYEGHLNHEDLCKFLSQGAAALVTPKWEEPFGLSIVEALACGTPIAALPRGAVREIVTEEVGAISRQSTAKSLAAAVEQAVLKDRGDCVVRARTNYDVRVQSSRYVAALEAISVGPGETSLPGIVA